MAIRVDDEFQQWFLADDRQATGSVDQVHHGRAIGLAGLGGGDLHWDEGRLLARAQGKADFGQLLSSTERLRS